MTTDLEEKDWQLLLKRIKNGRCTPFLGAGACVPQIPLGSKFAQDWAGQHGYPLEDSFDLARVAQFLAVSNDPMFPKEEISGHIKAANPPDFNEEDEPHAALAQLPLPMYITTNYDGFMAKALEQEKKTPRLELCRWNKYIEEVSAFESDSDFTPTPSNPLVFHLHGHAEVPESLVLTEDDYLDFLVNISKDEDLIPLRIRRALTSTSLLFIGYRMADWDFRVLFRSLVTSLDKALVRSHISVQIVPEKESWTPDQQQKAQNYLTKYFGKIDIKIYWGTARQFAKTLREKWKDFNRAS